MKFADEYFDEIKPGTIVINIDDTDDEFTRGAEYEVYEDEEGLFVVSDGQFDEFFNMVLAKYFVIKEPDTAALDERLQQAEADNAALLQVIKEALTAFEIALEEARGEDWPEIRKLRDKCKQALDSGSGAALLKESEGLRKVVKAAQDYIDCSEADCKTCKIDCSIKGCPFYPPLVYEKLKRALVLLKE